MRSRNLLGYGLAPLVTPLTWWFLTALLIVGEWLRTGHLNMYWQGYGSIIHLGILYMYGLPFAYCATIFVGLPGVWFLRGRGLLKLRHFVALGLVAGGVTYVGLVLVFIFPIRSIAHYLTTDDALGGIVASEISAVAATVTFWFISIRTGKQVEP